MNAICIVGTASFAGKSLVASAVCRILYRKGWYAAPFKAEDDSNTTYVTDAGVEVAYTAALQAWAANLVPQPAMNPVAYERDRGRLVRARFGREVSDDPALLDNPGELRDRGWAAVDEAIATLEKNYELLVCDGTGNPSDARFKPYDLGNLALAERLEAPVLLVVDADRGGGMAHAIGTLELLTPEERSRVKGMVLNKVRGDRAALQPMLDWFEDRTGIPSLGTLPWLKWVFPERDSLALFARRRRRTDIELTVTVVKLPSIEGYSDFDPLASEPTVEVKFVEIDEEIGHPDAIVLPRSRSPLADLQALNAAGTTELLRQYAAAGGTVLGLGNSFQLLANSVLNPEGLDGAPAEMRGLDLLPFRATIAGQLVDRERSVTSHYPQEGLPIAGRENRQGYTQLSDPDAVQCLFDDPKLGLVESNQLVWGTYLYSILDSGPWRRAWLNRLRHQRGLPSLPTGIPDYQEHREILLDALADELGADLNLTPLLPKE